MKKKPYNIVMRSRYKHRGGIVNPIKSIVTKVFSKTLYEDINRKLLPSVMVDRKIKIDKVVNKLLNNGKIAAIIINITDRIDEVIGTSAFFTVEEIVGLIPEVGDAVNGVLDIGYEASGTIETGLAAKSLHDVAGHIIKTEVDKENKSKEIG